MNFCAAKEMRRTTRGSEASKPALYEVGKEGGGRRKGFVCVSRGEAGGPRLGRIEEEKEEEEEEEGEEEEGEEEEEENEEEEKEEEEKEERDRRKQQASELSGRTIDCFDTPRS